jgi:hypothetical protein
MTDPEMRGAGLDPAHILAICEHIAATSGHRPVGYVTAESGGVRVRPGPLRAAHQMHAALCRTGYHAQLRRPGRRCELLVTGWDSRALDRRLAAMRAVITQLTADPTATAAAVIGRYRQLSTLAPVPRLGAAALTDTSADLRTTVASRCGSYAPRDPAVLPADTATALQLRATWILDQTIGDLVDRHLRIARRALALYRTQRQHTTDDDRAQKAAICRAVGFVPQGGRPRASKPGAQPWPSPSQPSPPRPGRPAPPPSAIPGPADDPQAHPARRAARAAALGAAGPAAAPGPQQPGTTAPPSAGQGADQLAGRPPHRSG